MALFSAVDNSDGSVTLSSGRVIYNVHSDDSCFGEHCPLHNPSDHSLRGLPLDFDGTNMVRISTQFPLGFTIDPDDYVFNRDGMVILRNSAHCLSCDTEIVSSFRHDFVSCSCGNVFVDGGKSYLRRGVKDSSLYKDTSVIIEKD